MLAIGGGGGFSCEFCSALAAFGSWNYGIAVGADASGRGCCGLRGAMAEAYAESIFVDVLAEGEVPSLKRVRGTNRCLLSVCEDRRAGWVVVFSAIDNLVKGSERASFAEHESLVGLGRGDGVWRRGFLALMIF